MTLSYSTRVQKLFRSNMNSKEKEIEVVKCETAVGVVRAQGGRTKHDDSGLPTCPACRIIGPDRIQLLEEE